MIRSKRLPLRPKIVSFNLIKFSNISRGWFKQSTKTILLHNIAQENYKMAAILTTCEVLTLYYCLSHFSQDL